MNIGDGSVTFIVAVNDTSVYEKNFLSSPCLRDRHYQIIPMFGYPSAARAYNEGIRRARHDMVIFAHQDLFLPESWMDCLQKSLTYLEREDPRWGVLGCYGISADGRPQGYLHTTGWGLVGSPLAFPAEVRTLDEILLIIRRSSGLRFDESLPHYHFYGTDICLASAAGGRRCYAVPAFCLHNTNQILFLPKEFYTCYRHIKKRWDRYLPIRTSCILVSRLDGELRERKIREWYARLFHGDRIPQPRMENPAEYWGMIQRRIEQGQSR